MPNPFDQFDTAAPTTAPQPAPALNPVDDFGALVAQFPGTQVTSLRRDLAKNARVGGVASSFHMTGEGGDFVVPAAERARFKAQAQGLGYQAIDEGDHIHLEPPGRGMTQSAFAPGQQVANPFDRFGDEAPTADFSGVTASVSQAPPAPRPQSAYEKAVAQAAERGIDVPPWLQSLGHSTEMAGRMALQGGTFGFSDELSGARAVPGALLRGEPLGEAYRSARDEERALIARQQQENPAAATLAEIGGGLLGGAGPGGVARAAPRLSPQIGRGLLSGSAIGGAAGAGVSEGETLRDVAGDALRGAAFGGPLGAILPVGAALTGSGGRIARNLISPAAGRRAEAAAERAVAGAMERGGTSTADIRQTLAQQADLTAKPEMLVDLAGNPAQRQLYAARVSGGADAQEAVSSVVERARGASQRVGQDVQAATAQRGTSFAGLKQAISKRRETGQKLYENAYKHGEVKSPAVQEVFDSPEIRSEVAGAYEQTRRGLAMQGEAAPEIINAQGVRVRVPTVQDAHTLKRALDARITAAFKAGDSSALISGLKAQREKLVKALSDEVPAYRNAGKVYRGDLELEEAFESGRNALNTPIDELRDMFKALPAAEKDAFRASAVDAILAQKVDRVTDTGDFAKRLWGNADIRNRLTVLGQTPKSVENLAREMQREGRMQGTYQSLTGNSATAMRQADVEQLGEDAAANVAATIWQTLVRGDVPGGIRMGFAQARALTSGLRGETADAAARILTAEGPDEIRKVLGRLDGAQQRAVLEELRAARARAAGTAAITGGGPTLLDNK